MPAVKALLMWWIQQPDTNKRVESLNKRTILTIVKLIPVVSAVLAYILILSSAQAGVLTTAAVLLAFFGFVFFFIGRKEAKEDKTLKILGWLDLLSTVAVIVLYALAMAAFAGAFGGDGEGDSYSYEAEEQQAGTNILASGSVMKTFENIVAVPTTFIVDRSGNLICPPFVGADVDGYKKAVEEYLAGL